MKGKISKKIIALISALLICATCLNTFGSKVEAASTTAYKISVTYHQTEARSMLSGLNSFRTGSDAWYWNSDNKTKTTCKNLGKLTYDYDLEKVAMQRAAEAALSMPSDHTRPNGKECSTAASDLSLTFVYVGENVAYGKSTAAATLTQWKEANCNYSNQGHRRNMLDSNYTRVGIACVEYNGTYYWVMELAKSSSNSNKKTTAVNSKKTVTINVASSRVSSTTLTASQTSYTLVAGNTASLPTLTSKVVLKDAKPSGQGVTSTVSGTWTSSNKNVATISGSKVKAVASGTTKISAKVNGKTVSATVNVYSTPTYTWSSDCSSCTATFKCGSTKKTVKCTVTSKTNTSATCTSTGKKTYTAKCTFGGKTFTTTKTKTIAATGHSWNTSSPTWSWSSDYSTAKVTVYCKNNSSHKTTVTAKVTSKVTKAATTTSTGIMTYTATATVNGKTLTSTKTKTIAKKTTTNTTTNTTTETTTEATTETTTETTSTTGTSTLATPTLNSTQAANSGISVSWGKVSGATGYAIFRKVSGGSWTLIANTTSTSYTDKTASAGTTYYYTVRAYKGTYATAKKNMYSTSYWSSCNSTGVTGKYIKMPTITSASANATGTTLKWGTVSGASGYAIWRKTSGGSWSRIGYTTSTSYTDTTALTSGTTYYYTVRAYSGSYSTANANTFNSNYWSYYDTTGKQIVYLAKPTLGSATNTTSGVKVTWSKVSGASGYVVYRKTIGSGWSQIGNTTSTSYTDTSSLTSGTTYYYSVRAYKGSYSTAIANTYNALYWSGYNNTGVYVKYTKTTNTTTTETTTEATTETSTHTATVSPVSITPVDTTAQTYAEEVADLVNEQRTANGLSELTLDETLTEAAMERAEECAESFSHTRPDGTSFFTILSEYGISYTAAGENIAMGSKTASDVMTLWMNSSGHAANILNTKYTKIGVGYYKASNGSTYWVQLFTK